MANSHHEMDSEDDTEEVDDTLLTKANILRLSMPSSVTSLWKAPAQRMTAKTFHTSVSRLVSFLYVHCSSDKMLVSTMVHIIQQPMTLITRPYSARIVPVNSDTPATKTIVPVT